MSDKHRRQTCSRRTILASGLTAAGATLVPAAESASRPANDPTSRPADPNAIPTSRLGKTEVEVTRLGMGASFPSYGRRLLEFAYRQGIRYYDNSERYLNGKCERELGDLFRKPKLREQVFLVTKAKAVDPADIYAHFVDSLDRLQMDGVDLFFLHGIDDPDIPLDRKKIYRRLRDRLIREKKTRFMGFSCHADMPARIACLENAAKGGWVDALMVACDPRLIRENDELDKALDACAKAGIGLVAMKTARGLRRGADQSPETVAALEQLDMNPYQAVLAGIWQDGRFASACSEMTSRRNIEENAAIARRFKPLDNDGARLLEKGLSALPRSTCPGCDGSCRRAAGTRTDFSAMARFLSYYEDDGKRDEARALFQSLSPEARSWQGADLAAASKACRGRLDLANVVRRAREKLA